jgi:subtilisin family serine protease
MQLFISRIFRRGTRGGCGLLRRAGLGLGGVCLLFGMVQVQGGAMLSVDLERLLDEAKRTSLIPVIIKFRQQVNITTLRSQVSQQMQYAGRGEMARKRQRKLLRNRLVTDLKANAKGPREALARLLRQYGVETDLKSLWSINAVALKLPAHLVDEVAALPGIERISVDMLLTMNAATPERVTTEPQWNLSDINTEYVWRQGYAGDGVVVAIMDSGVDLNHPDLVGRWRGGDNSWFDPYAQNPFPIDVNGHGTQALSLILGGDASGYQVGLAPHAQWIAARLFDSEDQASLSAIHQAFQWLLDPDGDPATDDAPDVVNNSWGFASTINQCYQEFSEEIRLLREAGIAVVFSAGNYGPYAESSISPANDPGAVSVGSVDRFRDIDTFSGRGPGACDGGVFPKLVAPGSLVYVADRMPIGYNVVSGTSFSAPHVTGAIALLKSAYPMATVSQIETALYDSATDLGVSGGDDLYGYGLINVAAAYDLLFRDLGSSSAGMLLFSESLYSVDETTDKLVVTVRRLGGSAGEVTVDYETLPGQAIDNRPADFVAQSGTLRFSDGETLRSFDIDILDDNLDEESETFYLNLSNPAGGALLSNQPQVPVTILDDDGPGAISFGAVNYAVNESRDHASVTLLRTGGSEGMVAVDLSLIDDSAVVDSDYLPPAEQSVRFLSGEIAKEVAIPLVADQVHEGNETFSAMLSSATGGARIDAPASATITILDDDPDTRITSLHMEAVNYTVSESRGEVTLTVLRSGNVERTATVDYATVAGSAKADEDYVAKRGRLIFRPQVRSKRITIPIKDDGLYEKESSFTLVLTAVDSGSVLAKPSAAIVRIANDDAQPNVSLGSSSTGGGFNSSQGGSDSLPGGGGVGSSSGDAERERSDSGYTQGGLKIFDLSLRGYSGTAEEALRRLQTLDGVLPPQDDTEEKASAGEVTDCGADGASATEACSEEAPQKTDGVDGESTDQDRAALSATETDAPEAPPAKVEGGGQ